jgi:hypothetical protein
MSSPAWAPGSGSRMRLRYTRAQASSHQSIAAAGLRGVVEFTVNLARDTNSSGSLPATIASLLRREW